MIRPLVRASTLSIISGGADPLQRWAGDAEYAWDFTTGKARFAGKYIGDIANTPGWSGGSATITAGEGLTGSASVTGVSLACPMTLIAVFERLVDTGAGEEYFNLDNGSNTDRLRVGITAADVPTASQRAANTTVANMTVGTALALETQCAIASRFGLDNARMCRDGTLGTADVSAAAPATMTTIWFNRDRAGTATQGRLLRAAILAGSAEDGLLVERTLAGVMLLDADGAYLTDEDGYFLYEAA